MAKHPHRLILMHNKTWKCTLQGCSFFVHRGLEYVLIGKTAVCWECGDNFTLDEHALEDEMPKCIDCRNEAAGLPSGDVLGDYIQTKLALAKAGVKSIDELSLSQIKSMQNLGILPKNLPKLEPVVEEKDEIEVIEPTEEEHAADCGIYSGEQCDCKV